MSPTAEIPAAPKLPELPDAPQVQAPRYVTLAMHDRLDTPHMSAVLVNPRQQMHTVYHLVSLLQGPLFFHYHRAAKLVTPHTQCLLSPRSPSGLIRACSHQPIVHQPTLHL
ncbi:hypothetical protein HPB50_021404 [Hyalomma asiaticum]|uniref:Uncharacterized protein n=1 Tax=Hyalomma asiaticum TaxID=266040 RepID=A0ACB7RNQ8_HYAAI|nr:hypothetical protein HPB50_021404 [Hyalomma asiaticum]